MSDQVYDVRFGILLVVVGDEAATKSPIYKMKIKAPSRGEAFARGLQEMTKDLARAIQPDDVANTELIELKVYGV